VPLIAAGGFHDGRGLAAALVLGADAISMGTRFMLTKESVLHENFKQLCLKATEQDTLYSAVFDGMPGRALRTKGAESMMRGGFPLVEAFKGASEIKQMLNLSLWQFIRLSFQMMRADEDSSPLWVQAREAAGSRRHLKSINDGDLEEGILFAGQDIGGIDDLPSCAELIERIVAQAEQTLEATREKLAKRQKV